MCRFIRAGGIFVCEWRGSLGVARQGGEFAGPIARPKARAEFDLAIVSVLLDAGAGPQWRYHDATTGSSIGRSEGLALASLAMFLGGAFSAGPRDPLRADADA
jgi:hypothetical protein